MGLHRECVDPHLNLTGRQFAVHCFRITFNNPPRDRHNAFNTNTLNIFKHRVFCVDDALRNPKMIAQVNKQQLTVIAQTMHPSGKSNSVTNIIGAHFMAFMGTVTVHFMVQSWRSDNPVPHAPPSGRGVCISAQLNQPSSNFSRRLFCHDLSCDIAANAVIARFSAIPFQCRLKFITARRPTAGWALAANK